MSLVYKIEKLLKYLPAKDLKYAEKYFEKRDFENLKDLVWSSLVISEKNLNKERPNKDYINIDIDKVRELAVACDDYYKLLYPDVDVYEDDDELDTNIFDEYDEYSI